MLLTIAIPAHNKSDFLKQAIYSIKKELDFGRDVNIVISDNSLNDEIKDIYFQQFSDDENINLWQTRKRSRWWI